ncbi:MAG: glycosyltransferase family 39 protein [Chloroflexota bacterium]|nr:glycosyltransferase family 39 protein [Chloroflexota bacterium]
MTNERLTAAASTLAIALLMLLITILHTGVYAGRNYREDEINSIHAALIKSPPEIVRWMARDVHPPGWRLFADFWVDSFGVAEAITRWSSQLLNLLTYALVFLLGRQLIDRGAAFYAVALLGVYGFAANGMYEFRPYAMLVALTTALHLAFYRWLVKPSATVMILYVVLGMAAIYTHFFAFYIFAAHAVFLLVFHRARRRVYLNSLLMWVFIALSFSVWIIPLLGVMLGPFSGGYYVDHPDELYQRLHFRPEIVFAFLLLLSLFAPRLLRRRGLTSDAFTPLRWRRHWNLLFPLVLLLATLLAASLANTVYGSLNARGLQSVVMLIALLMALGLRTLPIQAGGIMLVLLYVMAPRHIFIQPSNGPYREIVAAMGQRYEKDSILLTEFDWAWRWLSPAAYFLMDFTPDRMSKERMFHVIGSNDSAHPPAYPDRLANIYTSFDPLNFDPKRSHSQLWLLRQGNGNRWGKNIQDWLNRNYAFVRTTRWDEPYHTSYELSEYIRAPQREEPLLVAGDSMQLFDWTLLDSVDVQPCQAVTVESWWELEAEDSTPYTLNIILADSDGDGQLARTPSVPANVFTSDWVANKYYRDLSVLPIPCEDIEAGSYPLLLGLVETITGDELTLSYVSGDVIGPLYYLTTLNVGTSG